MKCYININTLYGILDNNVLRLSGQEMSTVHSITNAYLKVENGRIVEYGQMEDFQDTSSEIVDLKNQSVFPCYCDSHTHIVFAEPRESEFEMKIEGRTYEEIAALGGGILNSAKKLELLSEDDLFIAAKNRVDKVIKMGTGALEIKSGYGLTIDAELKMLRVIKRLKEYFEIPIKATYLGAHAIPAVFNKNSKRYIDSIVLPTLDVAVKENLVDYIDIFIEKNYFSIDDAILILDYADKFNIKSKLHVNQLSNFGALQFGVDRNALSLDHLEEITQTEIDYLKNKSTISTLLPSCSFFINIPYAPARLMIDQGLSVALASDYNPGSTPSGNMNFVNSLACLYLKMKPSEAFNASTINGANALELSHDVGSISIGKLANFFTSNEIRSLSSIPYSFGSHLIDQVYIQGNLFEV